MPERISSYRIESELGEGGMAVVYKARHSVLEGEPVAIKVLHSHLTRNQSVKQRFLNEARLMHRLKHPNIVSVQDVFEFDGQLVIVMEYVDGRPLSKIIGEEVGPVPFEQAIPLFRQILEGASHAHAKGIVHRDLKPDNILVENSGSVKITDFGIAKISGEASMTRTGARVGTPAYMAPEQVLGEPVDARTDVYSLGITLYEMLAGKLPFHRVSTSEFQLMKAIVDSEIPDPREIYPHIPSELVEIMFKAVSRKPEDRFQSCGEFLAGVDLIDLEEEEPFQPYFDSDDSDETDLQIPEFDDARVSRLNEPTPEESTTQEKSEPLGNVNLKVPPCAVVLEPTEIDSAQNGVVLPSLLYEASSLEQVRSVLLGADGKKAAAAGSSTLLSIDLCSGKAVTRRLPGGFVGSADSKAGYHGIITGENQISLWNSLFQSELGYIPSPWQKLQDIAFDHTGDNLIILAGNSLLKCSLPSIWRGAPRLDSLAVLPDDRGRLLDVSPDGKFLAIGYQEGEVSVYPTDSSEVDVLRFNLAEEPKRLMFSGCGGYLAALTYEGKLAILDITRQSVLRFGTEVLLLDFSFTGGVLAGLSFNDGLFMWETGKLHEYRKSLSGEMATALYGSRYSDVFAISDNEGGVRFFNSANLMEV